MTSHEQNTDLQNLTMMRSHQWTMYGSESHTYFYQNFGAKNAKNGSATPRAYIMNALAGKLQKMHKWLNRKKIENRITTVLHTIKTEVMSSITPTKYHLHHMITTTITINDLAMIVAEHHRKISPSPKCAVREAQATTTDKAHRSTMTRKDTKNKDTNLGITNADPLMSDA
jgi:hypothetical protein